MLIKNKSFL